MPFRSARSGRRDPPVSGTYDPGGLYELKQVLVVAALALALCFSVSAENVLGELGNCSLIGEDRDLRQVLSLRCTDDDGSRLSVVAEISKFGEDPKYYMVVADPDSLEDKDRYSDGRRSMVTHPVVLDWRTPSNDVSILDYVAIWNARDRVSVVFLEDYDLLHLLDVIDGTRTSDLAIGYRIMLAWETAGRVTFSPFIDRLTSDFIDRADLN